VASTKKGVFRRFLDRLFCHENGKHVEPDCEAAEESQTEPEVQMKSSGSKSELRKELDQRRIAADETISNLQRKDTERHYAVSNSLDVIHMKMRCHVLKIKKRNGVLTPTEKAELELGGY